MNLEIEVCTMGISVGLVLLDIPVTGLFILGISLIVLPILGISLIELPILDTPSISLLCTASFLLGTPSTSVNPFSRPRISRTTEVWMLETRANGSCSFAAGILAEKPNVESMDCTFCIYGRPQCLADAPWRVLHPVAPLLPRGWLWRSLTMTRDHVPARTE